MFMTAVPRICNELFWQCYRKRSVHYQIRACRNLGAGKCVSYFLCWPIPVWNIINLQRKLILQLINLSPTPKFLKNFSPYFFHGAFAPSFRPIWCRRPCQLKCSKSFQPGRPNVISDYFQSENSIIHKSFHCYNLARAPPPLSWKCLVRPWYWHL